MKMEHKSNCLLILFCISLQFLQNWLELAIELEEKYGINITVVQFVSQNEYKTVFVVFFCYFFYFYFIHLFVNKKKFAYLRNI